MLPLRKVFAIFLCENIEGIIIWEEYERIFTEDIIENKENKALSHINQILITEEISCKDFGLPEPTKLKMKKTDQCDVKVINYCEQTFNNMYHNLNVDQKYIFEQIISQKTRIHFIDGPGRSGKTFLYKTLIYYFLCIKSRCQYGT